ncbi:unnamed protein product, partial [Pocillopora meandrina]
SDLIRTVEGEDYNITCLRSANDTNATNSFNFSWHRSGEDDAISNAKLLKILDIKRNSSGNYSCTATNNTANLVRNITVIVYYKPEINRTGLLSQINSSLYQNSSLICRAEGNPTPEISWSKDGRVIWNGTISGIFDIYPSKAEEFGNYTCVAQNKLGKDKLHVEVIRTAFPPDPPTITNTFLQLIDPSLTLRWTKPEENGRPIFKYVICHRVLNSSQWNETDVGNILNYSFTLNWGVSYEFALMAVNNQGQSNKSKLETFTVVPEPTLSTAKPTTTTSEGSNVPLYAAAVGGGVGFLAIVIVVGCCIKRKRNTGYPRMHVQGEHVTELKTAIEHAYRKSIPQIIRNFSYVIKRKKVFRSQSSISSERGQTTCAVYANLPCLEEEKQWEFPKNKLHIEKYVGKGAFCVVAQARAEGLGTVAVKIPKENSTDSNKEDLLAEYELMRQLQHHPNIIRLMGAVTMSDPVMVLFEYIPFGDLLGYLRRSRGLSDNYYKDPDVKPSSSLSSKQLLKFSREIADGMAFLSANKIVHRDLAARNVLVGEEETCKITDFGMARDVQGGDIYQKRSKGRLPVKWTAVEALLYGSYTTKSDVWSYGIVLYEIFTIGGRPYPTVPAHNIPYKIKGGYRMPKPAHLDDDIYALMSECWDMEPDRRPTFDSISRTVKRLEHGRKV